MIIEGYSSYAANLEQRIITMSQWTSHCTKGRFIFRKIYADINDTTWHGETIGMEMVTRTVFQHWTRQSREAGEYIFKFFHDGIALYRKKWLHSMLYHWKSVRDIDQVINHYFYVDQEIVPSVHDNQWENERETIIVMRRKPVSSLSKSLFASGLNLGDFLVTKYNMKEQEVTTNA